MQRYVLEQMKGDDWRERLESYKAARESGHRATPPKKTIRVPIANVLSDTEAFKSVVGESKRFMSSLSVSEGIAYKEEALRRLDERFKVTFLKGKEGEHFRFEAKEPVEMKLQAKLPKEKFEALFGKGLPIEVAPGEVTIQGSPLWERINNGAKSFQMKQQRRGFINLVRLDSAGQIVARLESLSCDIEGGQDEWRLKPRLPIDLFTFVFTLDVRAIRDSVQNGKAVALKSSFKCKNNLAIYQGWRLLSMPIPDPPPSVFCGVAAEDRFRVELGVEDVGR